MEMLFRFVLNFYTVPERMAKDRCLYGNGQELSTRQGAGFSSNPGKMTELSGKSTEVRRKQLKNSMIKNAFHRFMIGI